MSTAMERSALNLKKGHEGQEQYYADNLSREGGERSLHVGNLKHAISSVDDEEVLEYHTRLIEEYDKGLATCILSSARDKRAPSHAPPEGITATAA
jgi:hypothetical protein